MVRTDQIPTLPTKNLLSRPLVLNVLKVPKCEILYHSDFHDFYTIKPFWIYENNEIMKIIPYIYCKFGLFSKMIKM
jgi:hypothetical protein